MTVPKTDTTDDNRLVDIRVSSPYRADYTIVLSGQPTPLNLFEGCFRAHIAMQIKGAEG